MRIDQQDKKKAPARFAYFQNELGAKFEWQKKSMGRGVYD